MSRASTRSLIRQRWVQRVLVAAGVLLLLFVRMPERLINGYLWAEDGRIFLGQAYQLQGDSILTVYNGYLHLLPRLIALLSIHLFPLYQIPLALMVICVIMTCLVSVYLYDVASKYMPVCGAWLIALTPLLMPSRGEVWLNITDLQWIVGLALLVMLWEEARRPMDDTPSVWSMLARSGLVLLFALSGPQGILFAPWVVAMLLYCRGVRHPFSKLFFGLYGIAITIQTVLMVSSPAPYIDPANPAPGLLHEVVHFSWLTEFLRDCVLSLFFPGSWLSDPALIWCVMAALVAVLLLAGILKSPRAMSYLCLALLFLALEFWLLSVLRSRAFHVPFQWHLWGGRYYFEPFVFALWAIMLTMVTTPLRWVRICCAVLLALSMYQSMTSFRIDTVLPAVTYRSETARWQLVVPPDASWRMDIPPDQVASTRAHLPEVVMAPLSGHTGQPAFVSATSTPEP